MSDGDGESAAPRPSRAAEKDTGSGGARRKRSTARKRPGTTELLRNAREQFEEVTGRQVEAVSAFTSTEDGWEINVEVVELARIPDTTSVLATYQVRLEPEGEFAGYRRLRRYARGQVDI